MSSILLVTTRTDGAELLTLLSHEHRVVPGTAEAMLVIDQTDVVLVDGRSELAWARTVTGSLSSLRPDVPILLLIAPDALALVSPDWGMAGFIVEGASPAELDARIRFCRPAGDSDLLTVGPLAIDEAGYHATLAGETLNLTYTEFELLRYLMQNPSRVLTREVLLNHVWGYDYYGGTRTVDVHVRRLRAKLGQYDYVIGTVRNVGYRMVATREDRNDRQ